MTRFVGSALAALIVMGCAAGAFAADDEAKADAGSMALAELKGKVQDDTERPIRGAVVHLFHLANETMTLSEPTDGGGEFELVGVAHGYYDVAIETADGTFPVAEVMNVGPKSKATLIFTLIPDAERSADATARRPFMGTGQAGAGRADLRSKPRGIDFWKSTKGIVILSAAGGAALLAIAYEDNTDEFQASPSAP
ncbi:hypothetical protein ABI59_06230 [Acidobacteria bacterium Mor1]|nr:hypothetical protein ABI59_06230 [Acidobacteria bacterium Mor1]